MRKSQKIAQTENLGQGKVLEKQGDRLGAIKVYAKILKINPLHIDATARLLVLFRKAKESKREISLLTQAISAHEERIEKGQKEWIAEHLELAERSRPLAKMLGLLNAKDLPFYEHEVLNRWRHRLDRLRRSGIKPAKDSNKGAP